MMGKESVWQGEEWIADMALLSILFQCGMNFTPKIECGFYLCIHCYHFARSNLFAMAIYHVSSRRREETRKT